MLIKTWLSFSHWSRRENWGTLMRRFSLRWKWMNSGSVNFRKRHKSIIDVVHINSEDLEYSTKVLCRFASFLELDFMEKSSVHILLNVSFWVAWKKSQSYKFGIIRGWINDDHFNVCMNYSLNKSSQNSPRTPQLIKLCVISVVIIFSVI